MERPEAFADLVEAYVSRKEVSDSRLGISHPRGHGGQLRDGCRLDAHQAVMASAVAEIGSGAVWEPRPIIVVPCEMLPAAHRRVFASGRSSSGVSALIQFILRVVLCVGASACPRRGGLTLIVVSAVTCDWGHGHRSTMRLALVRPHDLHHAVSRPGLAREHAGIRWHGCEFDVVPLRTDKGGAAFWPCEAIAAPPAPPAATPGRERRRRSRRSDGRGSCAGSFGSREEVGSPLSDSACALAM